MSIYAPKYNYRPVLRDDALELLHNYPFPGNVRELENLVEGLLATHQGQAIIGEADLRPYLHPEFAQKTAEAMPSPASFSLEQLEKYGIEQALRLSGDNKTRACEVLGISRQSLYRKIKQYGIVSTLTWDEG